MTTRGHIVREGCTLPVTIRKHRTYGYYTVKRRGIGATQDGERLSTAIGPRLHGWEGRIGLGDWQCLLGWEVVFYEIGTVRPVAQERRV